MTFKIVLDWEGTDEHKIWNDWCLENLADKGKINWAWISGRNGREEGVLFASGEDAIAFRLKFGL